MKMFARVFIPDAVDMSHAYRLKPLLLRYGGLLGWSWLALFPMGWLWSVAVTPMDVPLGAASWSHWTFAHFAAVCQQLPMLMFGVNSIVVSLVSVGMTLLTSVLMAYPLAKLSFAAKPHMERLVLFSMLVPFQVLMIPLFLLCQALGWTEANGWLPSLVGLTLPFWVSGFGMLLVKNALIQLPRDLEDAATLDGCHSLQQLWYVWLPLLRPTLALLGILTFLACWGELLWPSLLLSQPEHFTLSMGLVQLQGAFSNNWRLIAAGTLLSLIPVIVIFLLCQKLFIPNSSAGAVKG